VSDDTVPQPRPPDPTTVIRPIQARDNARVESIVRAALASFDCAAPGGPAADAELGSMSVAYPGGVSRYFVVEMNGVVCGGGGFARLQNTARAESVCELRKMYFAPELRGRGVGRRFLTFLLAEMRDASFAHAYLETTTQMVTAQRLYRAVGFTELDAPMGKTGHCECDRRFLLTL
jgi:putative acetyltransferase